MSAATTYINGLLYDARCFRCLPEATHFEIQTYILSVIAGGSTDPAVLVNQARGLSALSWQSLTEVKVYLLATLAGFDPAPNNLIAGSKCYGCIPPGALTEVQTYLLAQDPAGPGITSPNALAQAAKAFQSLDAHDLLQIQVMLLALIAQLAVDPNALIQAAKCMTCFPYTVLIASEVQIIDFIEPIPPDSPRVTETPPDPPAPPPGGPPPGRGGGVPGCTDTLANLTPVVTAHYVAGAITTIDLLVPRTCCKNGHYQVYGANASDMSGAVLVTSGNEPNRTGNWTITGIDVSGAGFTYYAAKTTCTGGLTSPFSNIVLSVDGSAQANDWANRVVINGGAMPSQASINASKTFVESLMLASIWTKMVAVNMYAPDSLIASITPLIVGPGNDPWTNNNFVAGDLNVDGLKGDGATKYLDTGVNITDMPAFNIGLTLYNKEVLVTNWFETGVWQTTNGFTLLVNSSADNNSYTDMPYNGGAGRIGVLNAGWAGYLSSNRRTNNDLKLYRANSGVAHALLGSNVNVQADSGAGILATIRFHGVFDSPSVRFNERRLSFGAIHQGLTQSESQAFFNAIQALRTAFGGGYA